MRKDLGRLTPHNNALPINGVVQETQGHHPLDPRLAAVGAAVEVVDATVLPRAAEDAAIPIPLQDRLPDRARRRIIPLRERDRAALPEGDRGVLARIGVAEPHSPAPACKEDRVLEIDRDPALVRVDPALPVRGRVEDDLGGAALEEPLLDDLLQDVHGLCIRTELEEALFHVAIPDGRERDRDLVLDAAVEARRPEVVLLRGPRAFRPCRLGDEQAQNRNGS